MRIKAPLAASMMLLSAASGSAAPIDWGVQRDHFEKIYKPHPQCSKGGMTEMDCSNFRARALKRFQKEWEANAYWSNGQIVDNAAANKRVNSELRK
jgi:hypothetical protein